jgi:polar amino acid transport system substrate-binding protein
MRIRTGQHVLLLLALFAFLTACSSQTSTWDQVQRSGVLHIGLDPTYPPFEFFDGDSLYGIDVDLAHALAAEKDLTATFSHFGYDGLYDALATGQVDLLISALTADVTRTRDFAYSRGYIDSGLVLVSRSDQPYRDARDLADRHLAVELGASGHVQATTWQRQVKDLQVSTFMSSDEALSALAEKQADAAIVDNITFRLFDRTSFGVDFIASQVTSEPYVAVVRREDEQLLTEINEALRHLDERGRLDAILDSWFSS